LHINDAEVVAAALLHDSVEDHAAEICPDSAEQNRFIEQKNALDIISQQFSPRVAMDVAAVTNEPKDSKITYDNKLIKYLAKVQQATSTVDGWLIKFSDWCDNAVGIVHNGKEELSPDKIKHFQRKYGEVIDIFEKRFHDSDIQEVLDYQAKAYVEHQLNLGRSRLLGKSNDPEATDILGF
jgi:(p)ppGpp synthase/HD superfamily hydrolase